MIPFQPPVARWVHLVTDILAQGGVIKCKCIPAAIFLPFFLTSQGRRSPWTFLREGNKTPQTWVDWGYIIVLWIPHLTPVIRVFTGASLKGAFFCRQPPGAPKRASTECPSYARTPTFRYSSLAQHLTSLNGTLENQNPEKQLIAVRFHVLCIFFLDRVVVNAKLKT